VHDPRSTPATVDFVSGLQTPFPFFFYFFSTSTSFIICDPSISCNTHSSRFSLLPKQHDHLSKKKPNLSSADHSRSSFIHLPFHRQAQSWPNSINTLPSTHDNRVDARSSESRYPAGKERRRNTLAIFQVSGG
jgi:hypothetical protein